jgi:hypothetical protein
MSVGQKTTKEKYMKKTFILMLAVLFTFSFIFIGCSDPDDTSNTTDTTTTDPALNGTWVDEYGTKLILDKGKYELHDDDDTPIVKGTYKTDGNKIIVTYTHVFIDGEELSKTDYFAERLAWYLEKYGEVMSEDDQAELLKEVEKSFSPQTQTYKLDGNTLTITHTNEDEDSKPYTETYTKQ